MSHVHTLNILHVQMSHVTHMCQSRDAWKRGMSSLNRSLTRINESCHAYACQIAHIYESLPHSTRLVHEQKSHAIRMNESCLQSFRELFDF